MQIPRKVSHDGKTGVLHPSLLKDPDRDDKLGQIGIGSLQSDPSSASTFALDSVFPFTAQGIFCSGVYIFVF